MAKWHQFRLFWVTHVTSVAKSIPSLSIASYLASYVGCCLLVQARCSHIKTTQTLVDIRQAWERGLIKSRPFNIWQQHTHELLVYCFIHWVLRLKWNLPSEAKAHFDKSGHKYWMACNQNYTIDIVSELSEAGYGNYLAGLNMYSYNISKLMVWLLAMFIMQIATSTDIYSACCMISIYIPLLDRGNNPHYHQHYNHIVHKNQIMTLLIPISITQNYWWYN